jgi:hypothetical protein
MKEKREKPSRIKEIQAFRVQTIVKKWALNCGNVCGNQFLSSGRFVRKFDDRLNENVSTANNLLIIIELRAYLLNHSAFGPFSIRLFVSS